MSTPDTATGRSEAVRAGPPHRPLVARGRNTVACGRRRIPAGCVGFRAAYVRGALLAAAALAWVAWAGWATAAHAQLPEGRPVTRIEVDAPAALEDAVRSAVAAREGEPLDGGDVRRSIQNIYALGRVSDVQVASEETTAGVVLRFVVLPSAHVEVIRFEGERPLSRNELNDALTVLRGDRISRAMIEEQAGRVQSALSDRGYLGAVVEPELVLLGDGLEGTLVFHLRPGEATRLQRLDFVGETGISEAEAREAFALREGGVFRSDLLAESIESLRRTLAENHYFYARIEIADQASNLAENTADLTLRVVAGPQVELNLRGWDRSDEELREMLPFYEAATIADWILIQARADIIAELQRQGHWKPLVTFGRERDAEGRNVQVSFTVAPVSKRGIESVEVRGNDSIPEEELLALMATREGGMLRSARFLSDVWEQDQRSVLQRYRRNGFLQARVVEATVTYEEALGGLRAVIVIDEGNRTVVDELNLDVRDNLSAYGIDTAGWAEELTTRSGGPFDPDAVRQDERGLRIRLANEGFGRALVLSEVDETADPFAVSVSFTVHPGRRTRVGQVLIAGNERVREDVIRRELSLVPGSPLSQEGIILSQSRLFQLGIFTRVDIETAVPDSIESDPTVVVRVTEGSTRRLSWGVGYSTEELVRGLVVLGQDNLWGLNHSAIASLRASFAEQRLRFIYTDPYVFGRELEGSMVGYFESIDESGFKVQRIGTSAQIVKRHSDTLSSIGRYSFRNQQTFDLEIDEAELEPEDRSAIVGSLIYSLISDTRPDPIDPRGGTYHTIDTEWAARALGSESDFIRLFGRSYWYWGLPGDSVLVAAARAGLSVPYADSIVPLPERFLAGGSTTLRGFGRNLAGPSDVNGNPLGGRVLLIGNLEYRFPLRGDLGVVLFTDVGNVFATPADVVLAGVRETVGIGARYATPIGPLRLDWGYLLDARPGESTSRFHFAIGQAF